MSYPAVYCPAPRLPGSSINCALVIRVGGGVGGGGGGGYIWWCGCCNAGCGIIIIGGLILVLSLRLIYIPQGLSHLRLRFLLARPPASDGVPLVLEMSEEQTLGGGEAQDEKYKTLHCYRLSPHSPSINWRLISFYNYHKEWENPSKIPAKNDILLCAGGIKIDSAFP